MRSLRWICKPPRRRGAERPRSLITVWLSGGPSQLETWDPHPGTKTGGPTKAIATSIPGVEIASAFPMLAEKIHHLSVIRSLISKEGDHDRATYLVKTGFRPDPTLRHPSVGAIVAHALPNDQLEIPEVISLGYDNHLSREDSWADATTPCVCVNPVRRTKT